MMQRTLEHPVTLRTRPVEELWSGPASGLCSEAEERQPLWLTAEEAELLVSLCVSSSMDGGAQEEPLFARLGHLLRSFREWPASNPEAR